ncbi:hypothetical protein CONLIGDRAFT_142493 [Coniochaeta ligniaria NRRL 30616]|uniref:Uncharacterized protein n=1 Tax=Coniochaeta ligniaria NRRL 30616 TaxID=1408157 RepID=A0A1J7IQL1_9PEZI|nr:hypothetical protein CONLIGDRAFT_142493 [Coniochaeta ligniaria NRRL 30616]
MSPPDLRVRYADRPYFAPVRSTPPSLSLCARSNPRPVFRRARLPVSSAYSMPAVDRFGHSHDNDHINDYPADNGDDNDDRSLSSQSAGTLSKPAQSDKTSQPPLRTGGSASVSASCSDSTTPPPPRPPPRHRHRHNTTVLGTFLATSIVGFLVGRALSPHHHASRPSSVPVDCIVPADAVLVHVCHTTPKPLPLHLELVALAHLELDIWQELLLPVQQSAPADDRLASAGEAVPLLLPDPVPVLSDLGPLVDNLAGSLDGLAPAPTTGTTTPPLPPPPPVGPTKKALTNVGEMLRAAGRMVARDNGGDVVAWLHGVLGDLAVLMEETKGKKGEDGSSGSGGAGYDVLVVTRVLLKAVSRELGPPRWGMLVERGEWLALLLGNLTAATDGIAALIEAAGCDALAAARSEGKGSVLSWTSWWLWLRQRLWWPSNENNQDRCQTLKGCTGQAARELICSQVQRYLSPRLEVLRSLAVVVPAVVEKHVEAETRLAALRATACELLVGTAACADPGMFDRLSAFFLRDMKEAYHGAAWGEPPPKPVGVLSPEYNDAWYGDFELVPVESGGTGSARQGDGPGEGQEEKNRTDWWRRKKTVGCMRTKYHFPEPDAIARDVSDAWQPLIDRRDRLRESWLAGEKRWLSWSWGYWAKVWSGPRDDAEGKRGVL